MKKMLSIILTFAMVLTLVPANGLVSKAAEGAETVIRVESISAMPGENVDVRVSIQNNPGIMGAILNITYDPKLTLVNVEKGEAFSKLAMMISGSYLSPCRFVWDAQSLSADDVKDGTVLTLSFRISDSAKEGEQLNVDVAYEYGDIVDVNMLPVSCEMQGGTVFLNGNAVSGDLNGDGKVNSTDVILLRRYIAGGYGVKMNESIADLNVDGKLNSSDVILLRRYIAGGYDVVLKSKEPETAHVHAMKPIARQEATCTKEGNIAYWRCNVCGRLFADDEGEKEITAEDAHIEKKEHEVVKDDAVPATHSQTGLTEGSHCSVCGEILVKQEVVPVLREDQRSITYHLYDDDVYLRKLVIENPNPDYFSMNEGLSLKNLLVEGYVFQGWYDGQGASASKVTEIAKGDSNNKELYAHWTAREYTIQFDSPLVKVDSLKYRVNEGATLTNPEWFGYTFMGWSDDEGKLVTQIPKGTIGNLTLHANWTSKRNQTIPVKELKAPLIYEDTEGGQYLFTYEIGRIENVPLYTIKEFGNSSGIKIRESFSETKSISESSANSIVNAISNSTTNSSSWSLSKDWNDSLTIIESHTNEQGEEQIDTKSKTTEDVKVKISNSEKGGSETTTNELGVSAKIGLGRSRTDTGGINGGAGAEEGGVNLNLGAKIESAITKNLSLEVEGEYKHTKTGVKNWNKSKGTEKSKKTSSSQTISKALSSKIADTYGYNKTHSEGGSEVVATSASNTAGTSHEYATSLAYSTDEHKTWVKEYSNDDAPEGYYRLVCAGTVHVFAVVGFDLATNSYYVYSFNVIDDEVKDFVDYSKETSNFDDHENGVLPFEVPFYVNEYIDHVIGASDGLIVDIDTGKIVEYDGTDKEVIIPEYMSVDNGDGTKAVVRITGIDSKVFAGNTDIKSVEFGKYVTEIPDNAFKGCTSLKSVEIPSVEKIGKNAFSGCTALNEYKVSKNITSLGNRAFDGVGKVIVNAVNAQVAEAAVNSGANKIVLNISTDDTIFEDKTVTVSDQTEYFEFNGANKEYKGLKIKSDADTTVINGVSIQAEKGIPLKLSSENITLNRVTVETPDFSMVLSSDATIALYGTVKLQSSGGKAVLGRNITLKRSNANAVGKLNVSGNVMMCGDITGESCLSVNPGQIVHIDESSYDSLMQDSLEWVLESELPQGAHILAEKWTYDLTSKIQSDQPSVEGYTLYDTVSNWGEYGAWSDWSNSAISPSDARQVETQTVPATYKTQYNYSRWTSNSNNSGHLGPVQGTWGGVYCQYYFERGWTDSNLPVSSTQYSVQAGGNFNLYGGDQWFNETTRQVELTSAYTQYRYRDRQLSNVYYFSKVEKKESAAEIQTGGEISNVQKWVQYVMTE